MISDKKNAMRTRRSAEDRRNEIIVAAKKRFAVSGFDGTSTRQIADDLGVAQSLLLYHFKNKEELWKAVMIQIFARANTIAEEEFNTNATASPQENLRKMIRIMVRLNQEEPDLHSLMTIESRSQTPRLIWLADTYLKRSHKELTALIIEGQKSGCVRAGDPTGFYYSMILMAGSAKSYEPEMALLSPSSVPVTPQAIEEMICATLFYDEHRETDSK